jgi:hypothetical protein
MNVAETLVAVPQAKELEPLLGALVAAGYQPRKFTLGIVLAPRAVKAQQALRELDDALADIRC